MAGQRLRVGFFDFTGCEGCQLAFLSMERELPSLLDHVEIVNFREATSQKEWDLDVAFIEGSLSTPSCVERINEIRRNTKVLVAFGSCAATGGVNALRAGMDLEQVRREVYGDHRYLFPSLPVLPAHEAVHVDAFIYGCPPEPRDMLRFLTQFLAGKVPRTPTYPVCLECKLRDNECLLLAGIPCLGVVTRAGCGAWCPSHGQFCYGCRGLSPDANLEALEETLEQCHLSKQEIRNRVSLFSSLLTPRGEKE